MEHKFEDYTPSQIVQEYHDAYFSNDTMTVNFLSRSNNTQQNVLDIPSCGTLLFIWTDSVKTSQMKTYVYSYFKYSIPDPNDEPMVTGMHIREALYYKDNIWRVGLGTVIDIGIDRVKNRDYTNTEV